MDEQIAGFEVAFLLIGAFRASIDRLHPPLAAAGFPDARPAHGFALQAIGPDGVTISELSRRLGVSKQAASKTVRNLQEIGYVTRVPDPDDARAVLISRSDRGEAMLRTSAAIFEQQKQEWIDLVGEARFADFVATLRLMGGGARIVDIAAWLEQA